MTHRAILTDLVLAGLLQDREDILAFWAGKLEGYSAIDVQVGVNAIIDSGMQYVHLGLLTRSVQHASDRRTMAEKDQRAKKARLENLSRMSKTKVPPTPFRLAMEYMGEDNPTADDRKKVINAIRAEAQSHPAGSELRSLWVGAGKTWARQGEGRE